MLLTVPFIEIGEKQKITIASICDKKEVLKLFVNRQEIWKVAQDRALWGYA